MTSSNEPPGGPGGQGRRRPPTIDLRATEVGGEAAGAASPGAADASRPRAGLGWLPPGFSWSMISHFPWRLAAAGAGGAMLILALLAMSGVFSSRDSSTAVAERRIARLEQQLRELTARPLPSVANPKALDELAGRLGQLETALATPKGSITDAALANRLATLDGAIKALEERIDVLGRRSDEAASIAGDARKRADATAASLAELRKTEISATASIPREEIEQLSGRIAALEREAKAVESQLAARAGSETGADRALRLVVVASALNAAVERGAPFVAEISAAKSVAPDPTLLAALEPFAPSGVPTPAVLVRELAALVPALAKAVGTPPRETGVLDRLKANAQKLVRVRPLDEAPGDDPIVVVQRIEILAEQGNLVGALADIAKLPAPARELAKPWMVRAEGRAAAIDASRRFAANALAALGKLSL